MKKLIILVFLLFGCNSISKEVSNLDALDIMHKEKDYIILDVRTIQEYNMGHINNALSIPHLELENRIEELKDYKNTIIFVYCNSNARSKVAKQILENHNFKRIYLLYEGYSEWEKCCI